MNIEYEIFKRSYVDIDKLKIYGFIKDNNGYKYSHLFHNDSFRADIIVDNKGNISGKVIDMEMDEEYINIRLENNNGEFVSTIREEYKDILKDIKDKCFNNKNFMLPQSNRIASYVFRKYGTVPEFLWDNNPGSGVFRNKYNGKWYGIIMDINKSKIDTENKETEIIDIKCDEDTINQLVKEKGFYSAYHMNKKNWLTIILDDTVEDDKIFKLIDISYDLINTKNN